MPTTPLPKTNTPEVQCIAEEDPNNLTAYNICLKYERELAASKDKLRHVRILGFLLLHAPTRAVRHKVSETIRSRRDSGDLTDVGSFFERTVINNFMKVKPRTPRTTEHSSRPSFEVNIKQAPQNHQGAKAHALIRDNWRCVATGVVDRRAKQIFEYPSDTASIRTHCAHIIPQSLLDADTFENDPKLDYAASVLAILKRFGYDIEKFNGPKMHSLTNVMTMQMDVHDSFDRLELYFESTKTENCYKIKTFEPLWPSTHRFVTFTTTDPVNLPVPSSDMLALHATCCKVAQLSGASEYIDSIYRDAEGTGVFSPDGTSANLLDYVTLSLSNLPPREAAA